MLTIIEIVAAIWFIFPAYCANAAPVIFGGGKQIDLGKKFFDGKPIFGAHKTFRGFISGLIVGTLVGLVQTFLFEHYLAQYDPRFNYNVIIAFLLSIGALTGDLIESFIKRRLNRPPGSSLLVADQTDFIIGALIFSIPVSTLSFRTVLIIILITIPIHFLTNGVAALLKMKNK